MGIETLIIIIVVIMALGLVFSSQATQVLGSLQQLGQSQAAQGAAGINPKVGQQVCDLKLTFNPTLINQNPLSTSLGSPGIGVSGGAWTLNGASNIQWLNCGTYGVLGKMNWMPWFVTKQIKPSNQKLDILISGGGQVVHWNMILTAPDGTYRGYQTDPFCITYCTTVNIPPGVVYIPKQFTLGFVIQGIPRQSYAIAITSDLGINGNNAGTPYIQRVS